MNYKHGKRHTRVYAIWCGMLARCYNKNVKAYPEYGGRGILVCGRWKDSFEAFYEYMGDPPDGFSLERIDNEKGYSPENCKWATRKEQNRNKRNIRYLTVDGVRMSMAEWSEVTGIPLKTISWRVSKGWTEKDAVQIPLITRRKGIKRGESLHKHAFGAEHGVVWGDDRVPA